MKTLVQAKRDKFGIPNKDGIVTSDWLNSLGPDNEKYSPTANNGKVRKNWLNAPNSKIELDN